MPVEPAPRRRTTLRVGLAGAPAGPVTAFLRGAPCWLLLCALVSAPWVYGSTRPWSVRLLDWQLGIALAGWVISCLARREWPRIHPVLVGAAGLLLLQGWWMTLNAKFVFDEHLNYTPIEPWVDWAPGTVNQAVSWPNVVNLSLMLGVVCCAADLGRTPQWRKRIWLTLALTGISIVVFGLVQKLTRAPGLYWRDEGFLPTFFGPFRYHANAGAFINLVSPLVAGMLVWSIQRGSPAGRGWWSRVLGSRWFWAAALAVCVAGAFVNTSRASNLIALGLLAGGALWALVWWWRGRQDSLEPGFVAGLALATLALIALLIGLGGLDVVWRRWQKIEGEFTLLNPRLLVAQTCLRMSADAGWFGLGPGTFRTAFPFYHKHTGPETRGVWLYAHEDYLQTLVEWGRVGTGLWAVVIVGGLVVGGVPLFCRRYGLSGRDRILGVASVVGVGSVLVHALGDFPLQVASIQLYVAVLLGLLWAAKHWPGPARDSARAP